MAQPQRLSFRRDDVALRLLTPFFALTAWAVISAFLLPQIFAGVGVNTPRGGMDSPYTVPLRWTMGNAAQAGYISLDFVFFLFVLWSSREVRDFRKLIGAFITAGLIASSIGAYQFIAHYLGLPYPSDFFNSNVAWRQLISEQVAGLWRLSATFSEPSAAGAFFAVWSAFFLFLATDGRGTTAIEWALLLFGTTMLLLTASTTGYLTGGLMFGLFGAREMWRLVARNKVNPIAFVFLLLVVCLLFGAMLIFKDSSRVLSKLFLEKGESASGRDRLTTIREAINITLQTWGLGVGLGSNRPSGMFFYILSNTGIPGMVAFVYFLYATYSAATLGPSLCEESVKKLVRSIGWAFGAALFAMVAAGGDMVSPLLWVCWALLAAGLRTAYALPNVERAAAYRLERRSAFYATSGPPVFHTFHGDSWP